ncbi:ECF transporter S component [Oribacterium sp. P6A1]|uniref:ECF transporter S component n=1 Tax=Oribacterium sp. P6A1 TaxID=1410612 RepID=UPI00069151CF|nr:ECF transporter S component [Oribacterium sp. P6A1]
MNNNLSTTTTTKAGIGISGQVRDLSIMAMFTAIVMIMAFTPFGIIDLPLIKATILHVPVVIGSVVLGPKKGAFLGFLFGATSLFKNITAPSLLSFAFTPTVPVPGLTHGSVWALFICFVPRILVGVTPWLLYTAAKKLLPKMNDAVRFMFLALCGALGAITNTALVMGSIFVVFRNAYATANNIPVDKVLSVILGIVFTNGIPEMLVAAVIVPVVITALIKAHVVSK